MRNPCCCCSLQTGTKVVAIINMVFAVIGVIFGVMALLGSIGLMAASSSADTKEDKQGLAVGGVFVLIVAVIVLIACVLYLVLSIVLLMGANQRHYGKCQTWLIFAIIFLVLLILDGIGDIYNASDKGSDVLTAICQLVFGILISLYEIWVVYAFMVEIREGAVGYSAGYAAGRKNDV